MRRAGKNARGMTCLVLSCVLTVGLAGCAGSKSAEAPELKEPISTNEAYRPVVYGDIGKVVIKTGAVVPTDYCYYYDSAVTLSKVYVSAGDYVEAGTVLAETAVDTDSGDDSGDGSTGSTDSADSEYTHSLNQKIFDENQNKLDWQIKAADESGDSEAAAQYRRDKAVNAENNRYENVLYEYEQKKAAAEKADSDRKKSGGTLTAKQSGYVTYAKLLTGADNTVNSGQNVVVISDYSNPYIEITGDEFKKSSYSNYKNMYAMVNGQRYELEIYDYTNQEIAVAQSQASLPYMRFRLKDVEDQSSVLNAGDQVSLYFSSSDASNVLIVGNDSVYEENDQSFVYVKTEASDKERRDIEIGKTDTNYSEVVSGLSEGELVYYASDAVMPAEYSEYTVSLDSYSDTTDIEGKKLEALDLNSIGYTAPRSGRFTSLNVETGQEVKKGDVLFVINSGGGTAELKSINNQIESENKSYSDGIKEYDEQISSLTNQIAEYQSGNVATSTDVPDTLYMAEQLACDRNIASYSKELLAYTHNETIKSLTEQKDKLSKNNDGSGNVSVYAEQDGTVLTVNAEADTAVTEGAVVVTVGGGSRKVVAVDSSDTDGVKLAVNTKVSFVSAKDSKTTITGVCVGNSGDSSKSYVFTDENGETQVTKCSSDTLKYYISLDDTSKYDEIKSYKLKLPKRSYENVVIIPTNMIYHETNMKNMTDYDYVWLINDGEMVKQYVTLGDASQNKTVILSGLSEGDVIAKETGSSAATN